MGEFPHFLARRDASRPLAWPGSRSKPPGTAELPCALSYGSGLAAAE
jgi:hypothetical protein